MFRLFVRDAGLAGVLAALLAGAALVLGVPTIAPAPAAPWGAELARYGGDPLLAPRDAALAAFALAALVALARCLVSGLRLLGQGYPATAHLAEALASRLARRAGALVGVALAVLSGGGVARPSPVRHSATLTPPASAPRVSPPRSAARPDATARPSDRAPEHQTARRPTKRVPRLRIGLAVRYIVQPDDTLDDIAARFGLPDYRPILRATRGLSEPVGGPIVDPDLIYPGQILLIPLPCPALRVVGGHVLYVVQRGDSLSAIAARFLGDWRRYGEIDALNRGVHQPDGEALENDNLIQPGWVLRLPQQYVVTRPNGATDSQSLVVDNVHPAHLRRGLRPRRLGPPAPSRVPRPATHTSPPPSAPRRRARGKAPLCATGPASSLRTLTGRSHMTPTPRPAPSLRTVRQGHTAPQSPTTRSGARRVLPRPKSGIRPTGQRRAVTRRSSVPTRAATPLPTPTSTPTGRAPTLRPRQGHESGGHETRPIPPSLAVPDLRRLWPLPLLLVFAPLLALVARRRRRAARAGSPMPSLPRAGLAPSMRRAIDAVRHGVTGHLERAIDDAAARTSDVVRPLLATLDQASMAAGLRPGLAALTRTVVTGADTIELVVEAQSLTNEALAAVMVEVGRALGAPVRSEHRADAGGAPCLYLTLPRRAVTALPPIHLDRAPAHPAPLLVPLGRTPHGADLYVNLALLGPVLIAGGAHGSNTLAATLLASTLAQATPDRLRLLVASTDDELRHMLPALEHLEAPPANADDVVAVARIVAQAHRVVLERFTAGTDAPTGPAYLVVLDAVEALRADPRALDRLDTLCRNGRVCGVHLLATTSDPVGLAKVGVLESFSTRLARPLTERESALLFGDDRAAQLGSGDALLRDGDGERATRLTPFLLTLPEVRQIIANVAVATTPDDQPASDQRVTGEGESLPDQNPTPSVALEHMPTGQPAPHISAPPPNQTCEAALTASAEATGGHTAQAAGGASAVAPTAASPPGAMVPASPATSAPMSVGDAGIGAQRGSTRLVDAATADRGATASALQPPVALRILGEITVTARGAPLVFQPREQRLLAALAVMGPQPIHPDRLVEALFPDDDPLTGQDKLQHSITDIRLVLKKAGVRVRRAGVVRYSPGGYTLDPALVGVDAYRFRDLLRRAQTAERTERFALLAEAVETYTGDLCGDQTLEWVAGYRHAWRKEYLEALYELALYYDHEGQDPLGALRVARRLAAEEPLQDHYHQMVLELIAATGDLEALDGYVAEMRAVYASYDTEIDGYTITLHERLRARLLRDRGRTDDVATQAG